ncbi:MAG: hypothetical protein LBI87_05375 [Candidatus Accumulibacter sp.]|jgi:hypothetical protein|nr:hypothetical protein [Accumulibacter sp.]
MKRTVVTIFLSLVSMSSSAGNFATCLLDKLPDVQNNIAAKAIIQICENEYPGGLSNIVRGSGRGWFGYDSGAKCAAKLAAKTQSEEAGRLIFIACNVLYNEPDPIPKGWKPYTGDVE